MRKTALLAFSLTLLAGVSTAFADDADLKQSISDLSSQTTDKERMDQHGATRVEVSEIRTWLQEATNAAQEEKEDECRALFDRVRAQLVLVDELIKLSKLKAYFRQQQQQYASMQREAQSAKQRLDEVEAKNRALEMNQKMGK